ncbi:MAG TPA: hypothetical protein VFG69_01685 [Nannocystaceae bacterium]|nr:hypothetical protein [Nannocystaceae bacterium]
MAIAAVLLASAGCEEVPRTYSTRASDGTEIFRDDFEAGELGPHWHATSEGVVVEHGVVKLKGLKNHPLWLDVALPDDVRIELDVWAQDDEGDVKVELAGDGTSVATSVNYVATGYVFIFGGWNNTLNVIARKNEHGRDRVTATEPTVLPGRRYHFAITRSAGEILWEVDGKELLSLEDPTPLRGPGHDRFALSGWEAEAHFDNVVIEAL